LIVLKKFSH